MGKEVEALEKLMSFAFVMSENMVGLTKGNYDENQFIKKTYEYLHKYNVDAKSQLELKKALQRLEAIDNIKPSEVMRELDEIENATTDNDRDYLIFAYFPDIRNCILKVQEQEKKYLKWEDLDTKPYTMKVKMGDSLYMLNWSYSSDDDYDNSKSVTLRALNGDWLFNLERYFFNDLRLERVEE